MEKKVLATINGVEITEQDIDLAISRFPKQKQAQLSTEQGRKQLLNQKISFELIFNYAQNEKMNEEKEFQDQLEQLKKEVLVQYAASKLLSDVKVTDNEVKDYYEANKAVFKAPPTATASHILVNTEEEANNIKKEIQDGLAFEEAAKKYSTCPSKQKGGNLGTFSKGQMVPEFEKAAFDLEPGVVSEPVKTQFGYHLIKVQNKSEDSTIPFEQAKDTIKGQLLQERQDFKLASVIAEMQKKYNVTME